MSYKTHKKRFNGKTLQKKIRELLEKNSFKKSTELGTCFLVHQFLWQSACIAANWEKAKQNNDQLQLFLPCDFPCNSDSSNTMKIMWH